MHFLKLRKKPKNQLKKKIIFLICEKYLQIDFEHIAQTFMSLHGS